jgi:hypothetical protein
MGLRLLPLHLACTSASALPSAHSKPRLARNVAIAASRIGKNICEKCADFFLFNRIKGRPKPLRVLESCTTVQRATVEALRRIGSCCHP